MSRILIAMLAVALTSAIGCSSERFRLRLMSEVKLPRFTRDTTIHFEGPVARYFHPKSYADLIAILDEEPGRIEAMEDIQISSRTIYVSPIFAEALYELDGLPIRRSALPR